MSIETIATDASVSTDSATVSDSPNVADVDVNATYGRANQAFATDAEPAATDTGTVQGAEIVESPADAETLNRNDSAINELADMGVELIDPKNGFKRYCRFGKKALLHARWQKSTFPGYGKSKNPNEDFDTMCTRVGDLIRLRVAGSIRVDDWIRCHVFAEAVEPMVPSVVDMSAYQVLNKFLPMLSFSKTELVGEIRDGWVEFVKTWVGIQTSDSRVPIKELDAAIAAHKAKLDAERDGKKTDEQRATAARAKIVAARVKAENDCNVKLTTGLDTALGGVLTPDAVVAILEKVALGRNVKLPNRVGDLGGMSVQEANLLAKAMWTAGNAAAITALFTTLSGMVKAIENASIDAASKAKVAA